MKLQWQLPALAFSLSIQAATLVPPGPLLGTQIWTAANSPYLIVGDVTVGTSGRIFIEAGTEVQFSSTDAAAAGFDPARCEFRVLTGLLVVSGTKTNPVIFRAMSNAAPNTWYGITVTDGRGAFITNAVIENACYGVFSRSTNTVVLDNVILCSNRTGVSFGQPGTTNVPGMLHSIRSFQNANGMRFYSGAPIQVRNSAIYNNGVGIGVGGAGSTFANCTIHGNGQGITDDGGAYANSAWFSGCILSSNSIGVYRYFDGGIVPPAAIALSHCTYWGNATNIFDPFPGTPPGTNAVFADPLYANLAGPDGIMGTADDDFSLSAGSPCIDAGDNSLALSGPLFDLAGNPRRVDDPATTDVVAGTNVPPIVDIGALEYQPPFRILSMRYEPAFVTLSYATVPGSRYFLEPSGDLISWTNLNDGGVVGDGLVRTQTVGSGTNPFHFYRLKKSP